MELSMRSRKELTVRQARRYRQASRVVKARILDEFVEATGYNRDYAAMLLKVVLFACSRGITSSRQIARAFEENVVFMALEPRAVLTSRPLRTSSAR